MLNFLYTFSMGVTTPFYFYFGLNALLPPYICRRSNFGPLFLFTNVFYATLVYYFLTYLFYDL